MHTYIHGNVSLYLLMNEFFLIIIGISIFFRKKNPLYHYFEIIEKQYHILVEMMPIVSMINLKLEQGSNIGEFLNELSENLDNIKKDVFILKLKNIRKHHKTLPLPETRCEFENRANMFYLANKIEQFIITNSTLK